MKEAQSNLEKCIDVYLHAETENSHLSAMKHLFVNVLVTMAILFLDCDSDAARKRTVSKVFITKAQCCLHILRNKYWSEMTLIVRSFRFFLGSSDLEYRRSNYAEAEEFARLAKEKAIWRWASYWKLLKHRNVLISCAQSRAITQSTMVRSKVKESSRHSVRQERNLIG